MINFFSGEFFLAKRPNGGRAVVLRSLWITLWTYTVAVVARELLDPQSLFAVDSKSIRAALHGTLPWFGAIFAGAYVALYTRFASQWAYLAELYNQIMATHVAVNPNANKTPKALAIWEAAFIEDADDLHLSTKPMFAVLIQMLARKEAVAEAFIAGTVGREQRLAEIVARVDAAVAEAEKARVSSKSTKQASPPN